MKIIGNCKTYNIELCWNCEIGLYDFCKIDAYAWCIEHWMKSILNEPEHIFIKNKIIKELNWIKKYNHWKLLPSFTKALEIMAPKYFPLIEKCSLLI